MCCGVNLIYGPEDIRYNLMLLVHCVKQLVPISMPKHEYGQTCILMGIFFALQVIIRRPIASGFKL